MLAALRPKMTRLSATESAGALPYFVSTARVAWMRQVLDDASPADRSRPVLAVALPAVLETDPETARTAARGWSKPYCRAVNYQKSLAEQGYTEADWTPPYSDRLMDEIIAWGDAAQLRDRADAMFEAGADHVMVIPIDAAGSRDHMPVLEAIAPVA
jgi:probable F420-dependent oxidoreductase